VAVVQVAAVPDDITDLSGLQEIGRRLAAPAVAPEETLALS
jgi:hypothetical protein